MSKAMVLQRKAKMFRAGRRAGGGLRPTETDHRAA